MNDEFKIQLKIADKRYSLICKRGYEEEMIRKAARNINNKILEWGTGYPEANLTLKDLLAISALDISLDNVTSEKSEDVSPLFDKIGKLNDELKDYLALSK